MVSHFRGGLNLFNNFFRLTSKKTLKPCITGVRNEGQWCRKCFHVMTSSWMSPHMSNTGPQIWHGCTRMDGNVRWLNITGVHHLDGSVQERRNSSALAIELCLSCTNPSIWKTVKYYNDINFLKSQNFLNLGKYWDESITAGSTVWPRFP